jgi:putative oxidoreductase
MIHDVALLLFRVTFGLTMAFSHGLPKLQTYASKSADFVDPFGIGGPASLGLVVFAEFFCALAVAAGLLGRWAAIPVVIAMSVAFGVIHAGQPFGEREASFLFAAAFACLALFGSGKFSIDHLICRWRKRD